MLREHRFHIVASIAYFLVLELLLVGAILLWPKFETSMDTLRGFIPIDAVSEMFDRIEEAGASAYVDGQHFFKGCNTVGTLAAIVFAMGAVAGEAHRGTLEIWLARPLSRRRILLERWLVGALAVVVPVFATSATVPGLLGYVGEEMELGRLMWSSAQESLLLLSIYGVTFLWSCASSRPIGIAFGMLMFAIFEFALYMIPTVTHASIFRLTDIEVFARIGASGGLEARYWLPLVGVIGGTMWAAVVVFARRVP